MISERYFEESSHLRVYLDRPQARNAINFEVIDRLLGVLKSSASDPSISSVSLQGAGKGFCSGDDIKGMDSERFPMPEDPFERAARGYVRLVQAMRTFPKPLIGNAHGFAAGAGAMMLFSCDFIAMDPMTRVSLPFARLGITAGNIARSLGLPAKLTNYMLYTSEAVTAQELADVGVVKHLAEEKEREQWLVDISHKISKLAPRAISEMKLSEQSGDPYQGALLRERNMIAAGYGQPDYHEGKLAFIEKRPPNFVQYAPIGN